MKKVIPTVFAAMVALMFLSAFQLNGDKGNPLFIIYANGKFGYMDKKGNVVVQPKYDNAYEFSDGLAMVVIDDTYGFIDESGKEVVKIQYADASHFKEGMAAVKVDDLWGFIDKKGKMVIKPQFVMAGSFSEGLARVFDDQWGYIDKTGKRVIQAEYLNAYDFNNGLAIVAVSDFELAYIDKTGKVVYTINMEDLITENEFEVSPLDYLDIPNLVDTASDVVELIPEEMYEEDDEIYVFVEQEATFPGGEEALKKYIDDNLQYPELARENNISGVVVIRFVVEKDGSLTHLKILRDIGGGCGKEALRMVQSMPKWNPAKQSGQVVRSEYTLPVLFKL